MIYRSYHTKTKAQSTAPLIVSHVRELLAPLPNRYSRGEYTVQVNTTAEELTDDWRRFWRYQGHFTLDFVKALCDSLPSDVEFISYDHLNNTLTLNKL